MSDDDKRALIEVREQLRSVSVRARTHSFRIGQLEAAGLRATGGEPGPQGPPGPKPAHKWTGTALSFENPDGSFDDPPIDLQGPPGRNAMGGGYVNVVQTAPTTPTSCFNWMPGGW